MRFLQRHSLRNLQFDEWIPKQPEWLEPASIWRDGPGRFSSAVGRMHEQQARVRKHGNNRTNSNTGSFAGS